LNVLIDLTATDRAIDLGTLALTGKERLLPAVVLALLLLEERILQALLLEFGVKICAPQLDIRSVHGSVSLSTVSLQVEILLKYPLLLKVMLRLSF
jgi:hypothetical protein